MARLEKSGIGIKRLFLDREFYNVAVIRYLKTQCISFVMPVIVRGKQGGTRGLLRKQKKSGHTMHTMRSLTDGNVTFEVMVVQTYLKSKSSKHGRRWYAFAVFGVKAQPRQVYEMHRLRFGIESSYRMMNQVRDEPAPENQASPALGRHRFHHPGPVVVHSPSMAGPSVSGWSAC